MNKLFTKIATAVVGFAMAIGVGAAVGSNSIGATPVEATTANGTAATSITSGKKYLVTAVYSSKTYYLTPGSEALGTGAVVATQISDITKATESMCWTFSGSGTSWTIAANGFYLANTNTNNGVKTQASSQSWTSSFSSTTLTLTGGNSRKLALYQGENWRCYSSTAGVQSLKIYEYAAPATYTITYDKNGAAGGSTTDAGNNKVVANGFTFNSGAEFVRWNTSADGTGTDYAVGATVTSNITLYCIWGYKVTYKANGGVGEDILDHTLKNTNYIVQNNTFTREDYEFNGWKTAASSGTDYSAGSTIESPAAAINLFAQWISDGSEAVTYTVATTSTVNTSGTAPVGSSATYSQTYGTASQMTSGNSITLTLSGFNGCRIKGITLSMKSNGSAGAGYMTFTSGSTSISSIASSGSPAKFNTSDWYGSWSTSYVDVKPVVTTTKITNNNDVVLYIKATTSSLYFQAATIKYFPSVDPAVIISTESTAITRDGSASQTVAFTATPVNFGEEIVTYEWRTSDSGVISVENAGTASSAYLKVVGAGNAEITCKATSTTTEKTATSAAKTLTVTNETYSGVLTITNSTTAYINDGGEITYTLTGNTHEMDVATFTSSNTSVISFSDSHQPVFATGDTKETSATVTVRLSSSIYSLEYYEKSITISLVDPNSVTGVHFSGNITNKTVNFGGNYNLTAVLESISGDPTDKLVSWESADTSILTVPDQETGLTCRLIPVSPGVTTVTVTTHDGGFTKVCNVTVNSSATRVLDSITISLGEDARTDYYDDETEVDLDDITLSAHYSHPSYAGYSETVAVANDATGVDWTLDLENEEVVVSYTVDQVEVSDSFNITVGERPTSVTFLATDHTDFADGKVYTLTPFTISVTNYVQPSSDSAPIYNSTNEDVRLYNGDYFEITCDDTVETIDSIEYVYTTKDSGKGDSYTLTLNDGDASSSYTKSGTTLTFTNTTKIRFTAGANQIRFKSFTINYTKVAAQDLDVESVDIADSSISIESGDTYNLTVSVLPVNARDISVTWESDDTSVAEVDKNGLVTGVAPGTCTITATSKDQPSIYDTCSVTVTAGPKVNHTFLSSVDSSSGSILDLNDTDFTLTKTGGSYTGYDAVKGAQFSSGSDSINVQFQSTDIAFATKNLRVIVHASKAGSNTGSIKAYLGTTQIGSTGTLTTSDTEFTFEYSGTATSTVTLSDLLKIELNNTGAVYIKSIKVYSDATASNIENFMNSQLHMDTYDKDGTYGSTAGDGSCKTWWNDVATAYSNLTAGQKALFTSESQYSAARARLSEWARINNYSFNTETGALVQNARISPLGFVTTTSNVAAVIVILSMMSIAAVGGYFFLRKRKED